MAGRARPDEGEPMTYETIETSVDGAVATITLARPERLNAISPLMRDEIDDALGELARGRPHPGDPGARPRAARSALATT